MTIVIIIIYYHQYPMHTFVHEWNIMFEVVSIAATNRRHTEILARYVSST